MEGEDEGSSSERAFCNRPLYQRIIVVVAGAVMNFNPWISLFYTFGFYLSNVNSTVIKSVTDGFSAKEQQLQAGDRVVKVAGDRINAYKDVNYALIFNKGEPVEVMVDRNGKN